jgi:hypothetical protein
VIGLGREVADELEPALGGEVAGEVGSSSAMRANMPWLPRVISETMLAGAAGR